jgi:hypothetical protein
MLRNSRPAKYSRIVPLYLATAHVSLALAFFFTAWNPYAVAGFFYHSWIVAIVHLVTIGWIAMSILGGLYVVLPMACGLSFPARKGDYIAYGAVLIGLIGMVAHLWIGEFGGMAWSAATAAAGVAFVMIRLALNVGRAVLPGGVKLHLSFACVNVLAAVFMGVLLGFDKVHHFLPGYVLSNVFAHAHVAAIGWAAMMMMGLGYRLVPMVVSSKMPSSGTIYVSAVLGEIGIAGLFASLLMRSRLVVAFSVVIVGAFVSFLAHAVWMISSPRTPGARSDAAALHLGASGIWLLLACVCGVLLAVLPPSEGTMRLALLYGVLGLIGGLAQALVGFERAILRSDAGFWTRPTCVAWAGGVPLLAIGFYSNAPVALAAGAWLLFAASLIMLVDLLPMRR